MDTLRKLIGVEPEKINIGTIGQFIVNIIQFLLIFSATVAMIFIIIGGYYLFTSGGNESQIEKGKKTLTWAVIGLILILSAYALVRYFSGILIRPEQLPFS